MDKIEVSPVSFIVFYNQEDCKALRSIWDSADVEFTVKDDLGNDYSGEGNGGSSRSANRIKVDGVLHSKS